MAVCENGFLGPDRMEVLVAGEEGGIGEWYLSSLLRDEKEEQHEQKQERAWKRCLN